MAFRSIAAIKTANKAAGHHFFDADTMRFFKSSVLKKVYGGQYFVTREVPPDGRMEFKVRRAEDSGRVTTAAGPYSTAGAAREEARRLGASRSNPGRRKGRRAARAPRGIKWLKVSAVGVKRDRYGRNIVFAKS